MQNKRPNRIKHSPETYMHHDPIRDNSINTVIAGLRIVLGLWI